MAEGSLVGDVRLFCGGWRRNSMTAEFDVGGWRPDEMISRVKEEEGGESGSLILSF